MLCLLYHEAKRNILSGRYPFTQAECDMLAGIQALITDMQQQQHQHDAGTDELMEPIGNSLDYFRSVPTNLTMATVARLSTV